MNRIHGFYLFLLTGLGLLAACSNNDKKPASASVPKATKPLLMEPFRYHKMIEVSPGQDYDVLSWGRGSSAKGAFAILHSDSAAARYTTTTGDLDGAIVDVYNSDMDLDGNPEIIIQAKGKDTINYTNIYAYEFGGEKAQKLDFPKLTKSQRKGYRGDDNFYIKDGILMREFPIYDGNSSGAKPTGAKRQLQYGLRNNSFTVKQLSKDSTSTSGNKAAVTAPAKATASVEKSTSSTKVSKHKGKKTRKHVAEKKHKKKRRRHRSE
ncbi:MAG TPA: hypothetical protein VNW95_01135 [Mucilaginibacter sp.]|jgi:hypothetical protein|nr:hypothetical protein [Mucilaginibacter sp.]